MQDIKTATHGAVVWGTFDERNDRRLRFGDISPLQSPILDPKKDQYPTDVNDDRGNMLAGDWRQEEYVDECCDGAS